MAQQQITFIPIGGINLDDNPRIMPPEDYRYAIDLEIPTSNQGTNGGADTMRGTLEVSSMVKWNGSAWISATLPAGTNQCIGAEMDQLKTRIVFFNYNSSNNHGIYIYNHAERTIYQVVIWSGLAFNPTKLITGIAIYDDLLFWASESYKPRQIDLATFHLYAYNGTLTEFHFSMIKWVPVQPLDVRLLSSPVVDDDALGDGFYTLTYQYVYKNGMYSRWAPFSMPVSNLYNDSPWDTIELLSVGAFFGATPAEVTSNNGWNAINHDDVRITSFIDYVRVAVKESDTDNFKIVKTCTVDEFVNNFDCYTFSKENRGVTVSDDEFIEHYDSVPLESSSLEGINNRLLFGDNTEGFPYFEEFDIENPEVYDHGDWASQDFADFPAGTQKLSVYNIANAQTFKRRGFYQLGFIFGDESGRKSPLYTHKNLRFQIPDTYLERTAIGFNIPNGVIPPDWATWCQVCRTECLNYGYFINVVCNFYDYARRISDGNGGYTYESVTYADSAFTLINIRNFNGTTYQTSDQSDTGEQNPSNNIFYNFQEGDQVYLGFQGPYDIIEMFNGDAVGGEAGPYIVIGRTDIEHPGTNNNPADFEVFRPVLPENQSLIFYEIGDEWYPILNAKTGSRDWSKKNWRWTNNAAIVANTYKGFIVHENYPVTTGDIHYIEKEIFHDWKTGLNNSQTGSIQSMNPHPDKIWDVWVRGNGRINLGFLTPPEQLVKKTAIRWGGLKIDETNVNRLNQFNAGDELILPIQYGRNRKLQSASNQSTQDESYSVLLSIHELETVSLYVNRGIIEDLSGSRNITSTNAVLKDYNTLKGSYGTKNPESVQQIDGIVIFWDANKGCWVRYSQDGLTNISELYKVHDFYQKIGNLLYNRYLDGTPPDIVNENINAIFATGQILTNTPLAGLQPGDTLVIGGSDNNDANYSFSSYEATGPALYPHVYNVTPSPTTLEEDTSGFTATVVKVNSSPKVLGGFNYQRDQFVGSFRHDSLPDTFCGVPTYKSIAFNTERKRFQTFLNYNPEYYSAINDLMVSFVGGRLYLHDSGNDESFGTFYGVKYTPKIKLSLADDFMIKKIWQNIELEADDKWSVESITGQKRNFINKAPVLSNEEFATNLNGWSQPDSGNTWVYDNHAAVVDLVVATASFSKTLTTAFTGYAKDSFHINGEIEIDTGTNVSIEIYLDGDLVKTLSGYSAGTTLFSTRIEAAQDHSEIGVRIRTSHGSDQEVRLNYFQIVNHPRQRTSISLSEFKEIEGSYYADIKNDAPTPLQRVNGDPIRSRYIDMVLALDPSVNYLSTLYFCNLGVVTSEKTEFKN